MEVADIIERYDSYLTGIISSYGDKNKCLDEVIGKVNAMLHMADNGIEIIIGDNDIRTFAIMKTLEIYDGIADAIIDELDIITDDSMLSMDILKGYWNEYFHEYRIELHQVVFDSLTGCIISYSSEWLGEYGSIPIRDISIVLSHQDNNLNNSGHFQIAGNLGLSIIDIQLNNLTVKQWFINESDPDILKK